MLSAILFDLDGVVINSHDAHERSWYLLATEIGRELTRKQFKASFGRRNETIIPWLGWADSARPDEIKQLGDRKEFLYREILQADGIDPLPGVPQLLESLAQAAIPTAIGTSTPRANVDCVLELTGLGPLFGDIVAAEDVSHGKPHPEVFLSGAERLGADPAGCVVIEDAHAGIQAAKTGGMKAIGVTTTHSRASLAAESPHLIIDSLEELTLPALTALWQPNLW